MSRLFQYVRLASESDMYIVKYLHDQHYTSVITLVCIHLLQYSRVAVQQHRSNSP